MSKELNDKFDQEITIGNQAKNAYEHFFKPFIDRKRDLIHRAFEELSPTDIDSLVELKRHSLALALLEDEMLSYIQTGKMAELQLSNIDKH